MFSNPTSRFIYQDGLPDFSGAPWAIKAGDTGNEANPVIDPVIPAEPTPPADTPPADVPPTIPPADAPPAAATPADTPPEPTPEPTPAPVVATVDWKAEMKKADKVEVLKEIGVDETLIKAIQTLENEGSLQSFFEVMTTDFKNMSDTELAMYDLKKAYPKATPEELQDLYEGKVVDKYKLDRDIYKVEDRDARIGLTELKVDMAAKREAYMKQQAEFQPKPKAVDPAIAEAEQQNLREYEQWQNTVTTSEATKSLTQSKKVVMGEGENAYNFEVTDKDAELIVSAATKPGILFDLCKDETGKPNLEHFYAVVNYAKNRKSVEAGLTNNGITLGKLAAFKEKANAEEPGSTPPPPSVPQKPAAALASQGKVTAGQGAAA